MTVDNRLALFDQAGIQLMRASGRRQLMQVSWIYEQPVDMDALRRFHANVGYGVAGRRVERSPVPFGRMRWVAVLGPQVPLEVAEGRPRTEFSDWLDERAQVPIDPERGPGWHMAVLKMTDGSTGVTMLASHNLGDGVAGVISVVEAVAGTRRDFGYPPPKSRPWRRAVAEDLREAGRGLPELGRVAVNAVRMLRRDQPAPASPPAQQAPPVHRDGGDEIVVQPAVVVHVDLAQWDARAEALGGTSYALLAGFGAKLGEYLGRARACDGAVTLSMALNERTGPEDTRAIALAFAKADVDPASVTTDLRPARGAIRSALAAAREAPDESLDLLPLVPWVPKWVLERFAGQFHGSAGDLAVYCSNVGDIPAEVGRPAGRDADFVMFRGVDQNVVRRDLEKVGGQLVVVTARVNGRIAISIDSYEVGADNSKARLRELTAKALSDFDISGIIT